PESAQASTANDPACSSVWWKSPRIAERGASFWRTSAASLLPPPPLWTRKKASSKSERPPASWENWPTAGGMRNGSLFQREKWVPAISESDGSALHGWMTPSVSNAAGNAYTRDRGRKGMERQTLVGQAVSTPEYQEHWPTPTALD